MPHRHGQRNRGTEVESFPLCASRLKSYRRSAHGAVMRSCRPALAMLFAFVVSHSGVAAKEAPASSPAASAIVVSTIRPPPNESQLSVHTTYQSRDGVTVHSPAQSTTDAVPSGASAQCRDGTYSFSLHRSGTCSHHGGVGMWL